MIERHARRLRGFRLATVALCICLAAACSSSEQSPRPAAVPSASRPSPSATPAPEAGLARIDPTTLEVEGVIPLELVETSAVAASEGHVWITSGEDLLVLDPNSLKTTKDITFDEPFGAIAAGHDRIWVVVGPAGSSALHSSVVAIDPFTFEIAARSPDQEAGLTGLAAGVRSIWATNSATGTLTEFDPETAKRRSKVAVDNWMYQRNVAAGLGAVVVVDRANGILTGINELTHARNTTEVPGPSTITGVAIGRDALWLTDDADGAVLRIPVTGGKPKPIQTGAGAGPVAAGAGAVWVANTTAQYISRIDEDSTHVRTVDVPGRPQDVAVGEGAVWVLFV